MLPSIIKVDKPYEERYVEFINILLSDKEQKLPSNSVKDEWCCYAESVLEPSDWQAVWKMSRKECDNLVIPFPSSAFVMVEFVDFKTLSASVKILSIPGETITSPFQHTSLCQLYPTEAQVHNTLYIKETAEYLDQLRFFYNHLWHPWDLDDDANECWVSSHLNSRLKLFNDMKSGVVPREMVEDIRTLLIEAQELQHNIYNLAEGLEDQTLEEKLAVDLITCQMRFDEIKKEVQLFENPVMRNLISLKKKQPTKAKSEIDANDVCLVWMGEIIKFVEFLKKAKTCIDESAIVKSYPRLQEALDHAAVGGQILVCPGIHGIQGIGKFENGGTIKGLDIPPSATLAAYDAGNVLLECSEGTLVLENLKLDCRNLQISILVRSGVVKLRHCILIGASSSTSQGILVLGDGNIEMTNCYFSGIGSAIVLNKNAKASLKQCNIESCHIGIQIYEGAELSLLDCTIKNCSDYGIKYISLNDTEKKNEIGTEDLLTRMNGMKISNINLNENAKGHVIITETNESLFEHFEDLHPMLPPIFN